MPEEKVKSAVRSGRSTAPERRAVIGGEEEQGGRKWKMWKTTFCSRRPSLRPLRPATIALNAFLVHHTPIHTSIYPRSNRQILENLLDWVLLHLIAQNPMFNPSIKYFREGPCCHLVYFANYVHHYYPNFSIFSTTTICNSPCIGE